jgi:hypothetical protein
LISAPVRRASAGPGCRGSRPWFFSVEAPDVGFLLAAEEIEEEHAVEQLRPGKLPRRLRGGVAGADEEGGALVLVELDELAAEDASLCVGAGLPRA